MPYIIVLVLVIAIIILAARKQKHEQKHKDGIKSDKSEDIYVNAEENNEQ